MVIAHHIILTGYGHWLPNNPRGSLSKRIRVAPLMQVGEIHHGRKKIQPSREELKAFHGRAMPILKYERLWFDDTRRKAIAEAFEHVLTSERYTCFACAILSNHAHLVIRRHRESAETMIDHLWSVSGDRLRRLALAPPDHPVWSQDPYKRFVDSPEEVRDVVQYVEDNPQKSGLPRQFFSFVKPYQGEWSVRR